jgi:hypothetical protein
LTALERAKYFVQKNASKTALVIVPLALASSATATPLFDVPGNVSISTNLSVGVGTSTFSSLPNGGVKFNGMQSLRGPSSGSGFSLTVTLFGTGSGLLDVATIPAIYDFSFSFSLATPAPFVSSITYYINGVDRGSFAGLGTSATNPPGFTLAGWSPLAALSTWSVVLQVDGVASSPAGDIVLSIPNISIAPRAVSGPTTVPEPASWLLLAAGTGLLMVWRITLSQ